ncbi:MAG TPA: class I SAM-dependent methyltransferase [Rhodanobacteraceae bacterium]|nr:class I SAM-dependent methyltransferase [Rhodanobacteraceae bacterium]
MAKFHFVEDYERLVRRLRWKYPIDEAMSLAVGGDYEAIGLKEAAILQYAGLRDGQSLLDLGCGSGRLAWALGQKMSIDYCGIDIVQSLLKYARKKSPANYRFILNRALSLPLPGASFDMASAFSVFTHLLHHESYLYLEAFHRVLRPGGTVVFSFLEFLEPGHWETFAGTVEAQRSSKLPALNQFIERNQIELWSQKLGYRNADFIAGTASPWGDTGALGQSVAILRR